MKLRGQGAAPGIGIGRAVWAGDATGDRSAPPAAASPAQRVADAAHELARFRQAREHVRDALAALQSQVASRAGPEVAEIIAAQQLMVDDPELEAAVAALITDRHLSAATAVTAAGNDLADALASLPDAYLRARAADVLDVTRRLAAALRGEEGAGGEAAAPPIHGEAGVVLVAGELLPSEVARLDPASVAGLVTAGGSSNAHAALLARALGIPAVFAAGPAVERIRAGATLVVDGNTGAVRVDPGPRQLAAYRRARTRFQTEAQRLAAQAGLPAETADGARRVRLYANAGSTAEVAAAVRAGAEGIGLLRSEFLYLDRPDLPGEDEQYIVYRRILEGAGTRPVIIRTLDAGGDKPLPALGPLPETNPALGSRGVRLWLQRPELWRPQLRALLRAAAHGDLQILLPMVTDGDEVIRARALLTEAASGLPPAQRPPRLPPLGAMIEVPAAALAAASLARVCDFFSIGTNDLTQYTLAVDRMNAALAALFRPLHPAVLQLCRLAVAAAHDRGIPCGVCGETAGDPLAAPVLVGLGCDSLSMVPAALPRVKAAIRSVDWPAAQEAAARALNGAAGAQGSQPK